MMSCVKSGQCSANGSNKPRQAAPSFPNAACTSSKIPLQQDRCTIIHGMRQGDWRVDPFQTVIGQGQRRKEWRSGSHRMHRGTEIMVEAGQRQLHVARSSAGLRFGFEDFHLEPSLRQHNGHCQIVRTRSDHAGFPVLYILDEAVVRRLRHIDSDSRCGSSFLPDQVTALQRGSFWWSRQEWLRNHANSAIRTNCQSRRIGP